MRLQHLLSFKSQALNYMWLCVFSAQICSGKERIPKLLVSWCQNIQMKNSINCADVPNASCQISQSVETSSDHLFHFVLDILVGYSCRLIYWAYEPKSQHFYPELSGWYSWMGFWYFKDLYFLLLGNSSRRNYFSIFYFDFYYLS